MLYTQSSSVNSHYREFPVRSCLAVTGVSSAVVGFIILALAAVCAHYGYISTPGVVTKLFIGGGALLPTSLIGLLSIKNNRGSKAPKTKPSDPFQEQTARNLKNHSERASDSSDKPLALKDRKSTSSESSDASSDTDTENGFSQMITFTESILSNDTEKNFILTKKQYLDLEKVINFLTIHLEKENISPLCENQNTTPGEDFLFHKTVLESCRLYLCYVKARCDMERFSIGFDEQQETICVRSDGNCLFMSLYVGLVLQGVDFSQIPEFIEKREQLNKEDNLDAEDMDALALRQLIVDRMRQDYKSNGNLLRYLMTSSLLDHYTAKQHALSLEINNINETIRILNENPDEKGQSQRIELCKSNIQENKNKLVCMNDAVNYLTRIMIQIIPKKNAFERKVICGSDSQMPVLAKLIVENYKKLNPDFQNKNKQLYQEGAQKIYYEYYDCHFPLDEINESEPICAFNKMIELAKKFPFANPVYQKMIDVLHDTERAVEQCFQKSFIFEGILNVEYLTNLLEAYFTEMEQLGTFGGGAEIYIASQIFNVCIIQNNVLNNRIRGGGDVDPVLICNPDSSKVQEKKKIVRIVRDDACRHFMPHIPFDNILQ